MSSLVQRFLREVLLQQGGGRALDNLAQSFSNALRQTDLLDELAAKLVGFIVSNEGEAIAADLLEGLYREPQLQIYSSARSLVLICNCK